jgi:serine phosphatase RsbU (regulator of sigma subunit)
LLRGNDEVERLDATGTVLGLFETWDCEMGERTIERGDVFALYTDGITESFDANDEEFGEERLLVTLRKNRNLGACESIEVVVREVGKFSPSEQRDDITMIVAKCQ